MKYLYYSLYLFYVKIIHVQNDWPPIISITGVMSFLISILCFSVINAYQYDIGYNYPQYSVFFLLTVYIASYKIMYDFYKSREVKLVKEMDNKPLWLKIIIVFLSALFIILVVKLWMFDGMNDVYQFIKQIIMR